VDGVSTVLHLATELRRKDAAIAETLVDAAPPAGVDQLVLISIVGIDGFRWATTARRIVPIRLPGKVCAGYRAGHNLVPGPPHGRVAFEEHLARRSPTTT
jgi:hypothetical protein